MRCYSHGPFLPFTLFLLAILGLGCGDDDSSAKKSDAGTDGGQDSSLELCTDDEQCSDGRYCNGAERCSPGAAGADERGCVEADSAPCAEGETCDEDADSCIACTDETDVDGDNHDSVACGGDDCDDTDPNRYPGNAEICDEDDHDEDCDPETFGNRDIDADGSYDAECCNRAEDGRLNCGDDCDDSTFVRHPGQLEICDAIDNDCDGETDEDAREVPWYPDEDGDGYGAETDEPTDSCAPVAEHSLKNTDCDDDDAARHPAQIDLCDGIDNNCDGETDEDVPCEVSLRGTVGSHGGTVAQQVRGPMALGVQIPQNAIEGEGQQEIRIEEAEVPVQIPEGYRAIGPTYAFTPHGLDFRRPVWVALPVLSAADTSDVEVLRLEDTAGAEWQELDGVAIENGIALAEVDGFSYFQVVITVPVEVDLDAGVDSGVDSGAAEVGDTDGASPVATLDSGDVDAEAVPCSGEPVSVTYDATALPSAAQYAGLFEYSVNPGASWSVEDGALKMTTAPSAGVWIGRSEGSSTVNWSFATSDMGNTMTIRARLGENSEKWYVYFNDLSGFGASIFFMQGHIVVSRRGSYYQGHENYMQYDVDTSVYHTYSLSIGAGRRVFAVDGVEIADDPITLSATHVTDQFTVGDGNGRTTNPFGGYETGTFYLQQFTIQTHTACVQ